MKKVLGLIGAAIVLISCSDDDSGEFVNGINEGELIGTWTLVTEIIDRSVRQLDECDELSFVTFTDTTILSQIYLTDDDSGECVEEDRSLQNYRAFNNTVILSDIDDDSDSVEGTISTSGADDSILQIVIVNEEGVEVSRAYRFQE